MIVLAALCISKYRATNIQNIGYFAKRSYIFCFYIIINGLWMAMVRKNFSQ